MKSKVLDPGTYYLYFFTFENEILITKIPDSQTIFGDNWVTTNESGYFEGTSMEDVKFVPDNKMYYNLSQEEIDQLVKELKDSYEAPKTITVPGFSDGYTPPEPKSSGCIFHEWVPYTGLFESFEHCKKCGEKKK